MAEQQLVKLEEIDPNPYQTRLEYKPEEVSNLALSIAQDGMIQKPVARKVNSRYQTGVGHKRTEAYRLLSSIQSGLVDGVNPELLRAVKESSVDYSKMPIFIQDLTDEQMFRFVVTENSQRSELSPIEEMLAMRRAKADFSYTSEQIGNLFGKQAATVRGIMRLGDLPQNIQVMVHEGKLSQAAARALLVLVRMGVGNKQIKDALTDMMNGEAAEDVTYQVLRDSPHIKRIDEDDFSIKTKFNNLPPLTLPDGQNELHLLNPPACSACDHHAQLEGVDFCALLACFHRKKSASEQSQIEKAAKKTGIALYQETDGDYLELYRWNESHERYVKRKHADLRLRRVESQNSGFSYVLDIPSFISVVATGKLLENIKKAEAEQKKSQATSKSNTKSDNSAKLAFEKQQAKERILRINREVAKERLTVFLFKVASEYFVPLLDGINQISFLESLFTAIPEFDFINDRIPEIEATHAKRDKLPKPARLKLARQTVIAAVIYEYIDGMSWSDEQKIFGSSQPAIAYAKRIRDITEEWGIKLGKTFDAEVQKVGAEIAEARRVAAETGKKK